MRSATRTAEPAVTGGEEEEGVLVCNTSLGAVVVLLSRFDLCWSAFVGTSLNPEYIWNLAELEDSYVIQYSFMRSDLVNWCAINDGRTSTITGYHVDYK
ncbi:hypothetical protein WISP_10835 [Willisornis vidua]|uniref:Uncharacterized protein n=1 Tax=Willisornis vidua TaxID=1566151 RepID=A0ABQ9DRD8_9PASS|nr:hypothetical protein WISP_10835 [Willisornis vidua]